METQFKGVWVYEKEAIVDGFKEVCISAIENDSVFSTFKQNSKFCPVIGNDVLNKDISDKIYNSLFEDNLITIEELQKYKSNDIIGGPNLYDYNPVGLISPGTIYFVNVLKELRKYFGNLTNHNIVEIGSGYGGQAKILLDSGVKSYTVVDIYPTLQLCQKYLSYFSYNNIDFIKSDNITPKKYDTVISNWCLSEFDEEGMSFYIENIIKYCSQGYFLMNTWDSRRDYLLNELKKYFAYVETFQENPKTHQNDNWVLIIKK
jgi:hypothetical protein